VVGIDDALCVHSFDFEECHFGGVLLCAGGPLSFCCPHPAAAVVVLPQDYSPSFCCGQTYSTRLLMLLLSCIYFLMMMAAAVLVRDDRFGEQEVVYCPGAGDVVLEGNLDGLCDDLGDEVGLLVREGSESW